MPMGWKFVFIFFSLLLFLTAAIKAQETSDTTVVLTESQNDLVLASDEVIEIIENDTLENRPNTAALYSAALPGLGQAYNKKYWKIPILYGGGLVIGYFINYNHQLFKQYRDGLIAIIDQDDRTQPFDPSLDEKVYRRSVDYWRRNRDLLMIGTLLLYVVNIVDANVDAHLELFTVDDDLSLNLEPSFDQTAMQTNLIGLSLKLKFN
jgi:hypothetical protein